MNIATTERPVSGIALRLVLAGLLAFTFISIHLAADPDIAHAISGEVGPPHARVHWQTVPDPACSWLTR